MNLRRQRLHHMGTSNLAYGSTDLSTPQHSKTKTISFSTQSKGQRVDDIVHKKVTRAGLSPMARTQEMYHSAGKLMRSKTFVGYPRLAQLEEKEKRKLVFTGESFLIYDKNLEKYRDDEYDIEGDQADMMKENLIKEKHNIHSTAVQETQLVGYDKHSADTLKGNVNLEKVREAKRVLRRRYASKKNLFSIYNAWDQEHKGTITLDNVYTMSKKLGLNLNVDEARVLLASANKSGSGELVLDEFLDLIYNKDDILNVDLEHLSKNLGKDYLLKREELERDDDNLLRKLEEDAKRAREVKHMNQTNLVLKNHVNDIAMSFLESDPFRAGYLNYEKFEEALKKLAINESVVSSKDIKNLFNKHKTDSHTINYRNFIDMLKRFQFQYDEAYKEAESPLERRNSLHATSTSGNAQAAEDFHIVDCRNLPYHSMVIYLARTKKVNRAIKRFFPAKNDFYKYLSDTLHLEADQVNQRYVNGKELKHIFDGLFRNFDEVDVVKKDFEGFLSSCIYNKQGDTNLQEVAKMIYDEEEAEFFDKVNFKKKGPGPKKDFSDPTKDAEDITHESDLNGKTKATSRKDTLPLGESYQFNNLMGQDPNLNTLLQKIDDKFFMGRKAAYEVFKAFDTDKDGYISRKDLATKLEDLAIMSRNEAEIVLDYVDSDKKGYVNFQEFSSKIRSNMVQQNEKGDFTVLPFVSPSKEAFQKTAKTIPQTKEKVQKLISLCRSEGQDGKAKTRYGASPSWENTFTTFQAHSKSPMFISEQERFDKHPLARIKFQKEENTKKKQIEEARFQNKQKFVTFFNERVENESATLDRLEQNRRAKKYLEQSRYEQRAKLLNTYV